MLEPSEPVARVRREVLAGIRSGAFRLDQETWLDAPSGSAVAALRGCGTVACIAGWAALVAAPEGASVCGTLIVRAGGKMDHVTDFGQRALGLDDGGCDHLFMCFEQDIAVSRLAWLADHPEASDVPELVAAC